MQGGSISPLLANVYLHYVFDLWVHRWRQRHAHGDMVVVRFADDFVVGFQRRDDAEQFLTELRERFARFGLTLHPDKTRLLEFGRFAARNRRARGEGKPESFNFLGFTHSGDDPNGEVHGAAADDADADAGEAEGGQSGAAARMHRPLPELGAYVRAVVQGTCGITACRMNYRRCSHSRAVEAAVVAGARSPEPATAPVASDASLYRPMGSAVRICHPYPLVRFGVVTQGGSRMR